MSITRCTQTTIGQRLRAAADWYSENLGVPLTGFATMVGIPYRSLQNYIRDEREPSAEAVGKLVENAGINANWLLTGQGEKFRAEQLEKEIVDKLIILLMNEILDYCLKKRPGPLTDNERKRLLSYMMSENHLGLGDAIRTLWGLGVPPEFEELPKWHEAITDMIAPAPPRRSRRGKPGKATKSKPPTK